MRLGGKADLPNWVPKYPGAEPKSLGSARSDKEGEGGVVTFETPDAPAKVRAFYEAEFQKRELTMTRAGDMQLEGESADKKTRRRSSR